jgi:hypothetical protein
VAAFSNNREMSGKRRFMRRFFILAGLFPLPAAAQQPIPAVQPVVDMVLTNEAELAAALAAQDVQRLQQLNWSNRRAAFELVKRDPPISGGDPVATALRAAHVACANAHSSIGMLASSATQVLITNVGADNTKVDNESNRMSLDFFLKPFLEQRKRCADRSGLALGETRLKPTTAELLPAFVVSKTPRLTPEDRAELAKQFSSLSFGERAVVRAADGNDGEALKAALISTTAFRRLLHAKEDPDMPRRDFAVIKECRWAAGHALQLQGEVHEGMLRPDIRRAQVDQARGTLEQYRGTKASCASILGLPRDAGAVDPSLASALAR